MSSSRNRTVATLDAAERLSGNARHPLCLLLSFLSRKSNFLSARPCRYLLALIFFCLFSIVPVVADAADAAVDYWAPWVTKTTTTSATINWHGASNKAGKIEYATSSYYNEHQKFDKTVESPTTSAYQHVQLTGLEPNTSYIYIVKPSGNEGVFSNRTFRTMPVSGPFTFIVISDSQEGHDYTEAMRFRLVAEAIAKETDVLFILHGGDYAGHDSEGLWTKYFLAADKMLAKSAIFTTIGNHEYHNGDTPTVPTEAVQYHSSYDIPLAGPLNQFFDCAGVRFIILDSPDPTTGEDPHTSLALAQSQAPWLEGLLKDNMAGVFTIHHHPIWDYFSSTNNPDLQPWEDLYHAYNISANFAGHTHTYQRYSVKGIPYFIVGNAGGRFADLTNGDPPVWYQFGETRQLGYLKVTVDPANNTATAQAIFVASVQDDDSAVLPVVNNPMIIGDTITFPLSLMKPSVSGSGGSGHGCFIATAAFGSYFDPRVKILRDFRDTFLFTNQVGQSFVNWYYKVSPPIADFIRTREIMKTGVRIILLPAVGFAYLCLKVGALPMLLVFFFTAAFIYLGIRRFYVTNIPLTHKNLP
jgi:hypothetical protein